jgi:hypothetical protein
MVHYDKVYFNIVGCLHTGLFALKFGAHKFIDLTPKVVTRLSFLQVILRY